MSQTVEATAVEPNNIFYLLSKENQLKENPKITKELNLFYTANNQLALLRTLTEAHSCLLDVHKNKLSRNHIKNIKILVTFVSHLTHFQTTKK